jgi:multidrug efflux pump subunit AcrB
MPVYTVVTANAKPAVLLNINRQPAGNTVAVANAVHAEIDQIRKELPKGVELRPFYDQSSSSSNPSPACATPSCSAWYWPR